VNGDGERGTRGQPPLTHDRAVQVLGVGFRAEANGGIVLLGFVVNEAHEARGASDEQQQQAGRERVERAGVADALLAERPARDRNDVVR
jgi:hypothetical protein